MATQYLTAAGLEKIKKEVEHLKKVTRKEITERIEAAIELGDLSENAEYHEAKEAQGLNEAKIRELEKTRSPTLSLISSRRWIPTSVLDADLLHPS